MKYINKCIALKTVPDTSKLSKSVNQYCDYQLTIFIIMKGERLPEGDPKSKFHFIGEI